jgi:hypothetical protein
MFSVDRYSKRMKIVHAQVQSVCVKKVAIARDGCQASKEPIDRRGKPVGVRLAVLRRGTAADKRVKGTYPKPDFYES